ncbi:MAG: proteinase inhibitor I4 serpin [Actinobacteria bacterium]|nr:proteinase inhibitor I4 serpin [Actinomycetota bacterium]
MTSLTPVRSAAVATLTARWLADLPLERGTVVSGAGLWPLLAFLAGAADGEARTELAEAAGVKPEQAAPVARDLLAVLAASPDVRSAIGTWTRDSIQLAEWWQTEVPSDTIGRLPSDEAAAQRVVDAWARERTDGLIDKMPVEIDPDVDVLLATALLLRTTWTKPFETVRLPEGGSRLRRDTPGLDDVCAVGDGRVTVVTVRGQNDVDVELAIGPVDAAPADVLGELLTSAPALTGAQLLTHHCAAPATSIVEARGRAPFTRLTVPAFEIRVTHDLLRQASTLGLEAAADFRHARFPGVSPQPLWVTKAAQEVVACFFATGFEAAALTAIGMKTLSFHHEPTTQCLAVVLDRPFGFAAVHRPTKMPLFAGWVTETFWKN